MENQLGGPSCDSLTSNNWVVDWSSDNPRGDITLPIPENKGLFKVSLPHTVRSYVRDGKYIAEDCIVEKLLAEQTVIDADSVDHQCQVSLLVALICDEMGIPTYFTRCYTLGAKIHDIGKIIVPPEILNKPEKLTRAEERQVKSHPTLGNIFMSILDISLPIKSIVVQHHERVDGRGYPRRLKGVDIDLGAQITSVADYYDALRTARPYKEEKSPEEALEELLKGRGRRHSSKVVDAFVSVHKEGFVEKIYDQNSVSGRLLKIIISAETLGSP